MIRRLRGPARHCRGAIQRLAHRAASRAPEDLAAPWTETHDPRATAADIFYCFRLLLNRTPHAHEWPGHSSRAGESLEAVVASYVNAEEFRLRGLLQHEISDDLRCAEFDAYRLWASRNDLAVGKHVLSGPYEPHVCRVFYDTLRPGMGVVDVGANIGFFSMLAASRVGCDGFVHAIEPSRDNVRLIEASRRENGFTHLNILQAAASREPGLLTLHADQTNAMARGLPDDLGALLNANVVSAIPLDAVLPPARRVDLIKADVEGAEHEVFVGAESTIARWKPRLIWEFTPYLIEGMSGLSWRDHLGYVMDLGYRIFVLRHDGEPCACDTADAVFAAFEASGHDHIDLLGEPV
jgi:FkbM family methyltransferase